MPKIHIDEVYTKDDVYPMILNFQNGYATDQFKAKKCSLLSNVETGKKCVAFMLNDMLYAGDEEDEQLSKTLILAKNRETGKVRLIEVSNAQVKPVLKLDNESNDLVDASFLELTRKFGSKKQKKRVEQREKFKVNVETVTTQMQDVTKNIKEDKLNLSSYNTSDSDDFYIPPINKTAQKPEDVYDMDNILTEEQYDQIFSEVENKDYKAAFTPFIKSIIGDKTLSKRKTVLAVYANSLLKYANTIMKEVVKKTYVACAHSPTLNNIILDNFCTQSNGRRCRPNPYKDKALCHVIVFALLLNELQFSLESLCEETKLTANNASMKVKVTGASVVISGSKKIVQLKLPLSTKGGFRRKSAKF